MPQRYSTYLKRTVPIHSHKYAYLKINFPAGPFGNWRCDFTVVSSFGTGLPTWVYEMSTSKQVVLLLTSPTLKEVALLCADPDCESIDA